MFCKNTNIFSNMNFGMITLNQSTKTKRNYVTWIPTALLFILKQKIFIKTLLMMLKNGLTHQTTDDNRPFPIGWNEKIIGLFKDELGGRIMKEFVGLGQKHMHTHKHMMIVSVKKLKEQKTCLKKRGPMFKNYIDWLFNNKIILKSQQRFKSYCHSVYTEQINKIALSSNDDKRLQTFDKITRYPYGTNALK